MYDVSDFSTDPGEYIRADATTFEVKSPVTTSTLLIQSDGRLEKHFEVDSFWKRAVEHILLVLRISTITL